MMLMMELHDIYESEETMEMAWLRLGEACYELQEVIVSTVEPALKTLISATSRHERALKKMEKYERSTRYLREIKR